MAKLHHHHQGNASRQELGNGFARIKMVLSLSLSLTGGRKKNRKAQRSDFLRFLLSFPKLCGAALFRFNPAGFYARNYKCRMPWRERNRGMMQLLHADQRNTLEFASCVPRLAGYCKHSAHSAVSSHRRRWGEG